MITFAKTLRFLSPVRTTALGAGLLLALAASGCSSTSTDENEPANHGDPQESSEQSNGGGGNGGNGGGEAGHNAEDFTDPIGCPGRSTLIPACSYVTTAEANLAAGYTPIAPNEDFAKTGRTIFDLFQPTDECKSEIKKHFAFDAGWDKDPHALDYAVTALHTLFFHPLMVPADHAFIWPASPLKMEEGMFDYFGAMPIPEGHDYVLPRNYVNESLMTQFRSNVTSIRYLADIVKGSEIVHMQTYASQVEVNAYWLIRAEGVVKDDPTALSRIKYTLAGTFFHEMQHADGYVSHEGCSTKIFGSQASCNDTLAQSAFGRQAQLGQAMTLGALYTRLPNSFERMTSDATIRHVYRENCLASTERVNDLASWVRDHDLQRDACNKTTVIDAAFAARKQPPAGAMGPTGEEAGPEWYCQ